MSTQENQEAFRQVIAEAFNKGNYALLPLCFDPDFVEHQFGLHATIEGMQGDIQFLRVYWNGAGGGARDLGKRPLDDRPGRTGPDPGQLLPAGGEGPVRRRPQA